MQFPLSKRSLAGWTKLVPSQFAIPITRDYLLPLFQKMWSSGNAVAAVALAAQWACFSCSSEILSLKQNDVALPGDRRIARYSEQIVGINIKCAKTRTNQFTAMKDKQLIAMIQCYKLQERSSDTVLPISYSNYLLAVRDAADYFQLSPRITTHSARIGGALHDFIRGTSAESIVSIGRWSSLSSLQHYLRNGRSWVMTMPLGPRSEARRRRFSTAARETLQKCEVYRQNVSSASRDQPDPREGHQE